MSRAAESVGCRELWAAVLSQAIRDALHGVSGAGSLDERKFHTDRAQAWFVNAGPSFRLVCSLAGVDPMQVRRAVLSQIAEKRPDTRRAGQRQVRRSCATASPARSL